MSWWYSTNKYCLCSQSLKHLYTEPFRVELPCCSKTIENSKMSHRVSRVTCSFITINTDTESLPHTSPCCWISNPKQHSIQNSPGWTLYLLLCDTFCWKYIVSSCFQKPFSRVTSSVGRANVIKCRILSALSFKTLCHCLVLKKDS